MNYLDTIAAQPQVKTMNPMLLWVIIGGVLVFAAVVIMLVLSAGGGSTDKVTRFGARVSSLQTVSTESQETIKSGGLRTLNSSLGLVLTNTNRELQEPLTALGVKIDNEKQSTVAAVAAETEELKQRLEDARLNATFDRTYAREITFYLKSLRTEMRDIYSSTKSDELKEVLETTDANLAPLLTGFSDFNES
jgi:hypothetical protein